MNPSRESGRRRHQARQVRYGAAAPVETLRKMLVAMSRDIRVLLDRIHNARTWRFVPAESAAKKAQRR